MCLTVDGQFLITGDKGGLIYIWNASVSQLQSGASNTIDPHDNGLVCTFELHKDQGQINNLIAIRRPLSLFGLTANMKAYEVPSIQPLQKNMQGDNNQIGSKPKDDEDLIELGLALTTF